MKLRSICIALPLIVGCVVTAFATSADFSRASIERRIAAGYRDAAKELVNPPKTAADLKAAIARQT